MIAPKKLQDIIDGFGGIYSAPLVSGLRQNQRTFFLIPFGNNYRLIRLCLESQCQRAWDASQFSVDPNFAEKQKAFLLVFIQIRKKTCDLQHQDGERKIKPGPVFLECRRGKID